MSEINNNNPAENNFIEYTAVELSWPSRFKLGFMRLVIKNLLKFMFHGKHSTIARFQLKTASSKLPYIDGVPIQYDIIGLNAGHVFGKLADTSRPVVLWLHGGAFILPAAPTAHHVMVGKLCQQLEANGFMPDYRLAPQNPFPAGLNDCEAAYRELLELGYSPSQIVLGGDSAGGNLVFGLLQRIRKAKLPMPVCAIAVSPVTELGRVQGLPSRTENLNFDSLIPATGMSGIWEHYGSGQDSSNPELSPIYMDCKGLPPLFFIAGEHEVLRDDTLFLAKRCHAAGVSTRCLIWEKLPHAFPLFAKVLPEAARSCEDISAFAQQHLMEAKKEPSVKKPTARRRKAAVQPI